MRRGRRHRSARRVWQASCKLEYDATPAKIGESSGWTRRSAFDPRLYSGGRAQRFALLSSHVCLHRLSTPLAASRPLISLLQR